jgi:hypothetical protein
MIKQKVIELLEAELGRPLQESELDSVKQAVIRELREIINRQKPLLEETDQVLATYRSNIPERHRVEALYGKALETRNAIIEEIRN